jgi:hypothetical protein
MPSLKFILLFFIVASIAACTSSNAENKGKEQPLEITAASTKEKAENKEEAKEEKLTDTSPIETPKVAVAEVKKEKNIEKKKEERRDSPFDNSDKYTLNPFGPGAKGSGGSFGNDNGEWGNGAGSVPGTGIKANPNRVRLSEPSVTHIASEEEVIVVLKLTVNAAGKVLSATRSSLTTTTDTRIINQVITAVKNQVKYNETPGAELESQVIMVLIPAVAIEQEEER